jgi:hypothetical protein
MMPSARMAVFTCAATRFRQAAAVSACFSSPDSDPRDAAFEAPLRLFSTRDSSAARLVPLNFCKARAAEAMSISSIARQSRDDIGFGSHYRGKEIVGRPPGPLARSRHLCRKGLWPKEI